MADPLELMKIDPMTAPFVMCIAGQYKEGKTHLAATANETEMFGPALILSYEEGGVERIQPFFDDAIPVVEARSYGSVLSKLKAIRSRQMAGTLGYKTIILDTYSEIYKGTLREFAVRRLKGYTPEQYMALSEDQVDEVLSNARGETVSQYEYKETNAAMRDIIRRFRQLNMNVIITCHANYAVDYRDDKPVPGSEHWELAVTENAASPVTNYVDTIAWLTVEETSKPKLNADGSQAKDGANKPIYETVSERWLITEKTRRAPFAKAAGKGKFIGNMSDPHFSKIEARILKGLEKRKNG